MHCHRNPTLVPDIQGSIVASLDSGSGTLSKLGYLPYGKSASTGPFGYTGQRIDVEAGGLYYYRARHYSPVWGRFLQTDPVVNTTDSRPGATSNATSSFAGGLVAADLAGILASQVGTGTGNLYLYIANDPLNGTDPLGLYTLQIGFAGTIGPVPVGIGLAFDTQGNTGFYGFTGGAATFGASVDAGVNIVVTNAQTISNLTGPFLNASAHGGAGYGGSVDYTRGPSANGQVSGVGITLGAAAGVSVSAGVTNTWVIPFSIVSPAK